VASSDDSLNLLEKIPPQSRDAEMSVLGAMMFEEAAFVKAIEILRADFFYDENHRKIFSAMSGLFGKNRPIDLVTVSDELKRNNHLEEIGGGGSPPRFRPPPILTITRISSKKKRCCAA